MTTKQKPAAGRSPSKAWKEMERRMEALERELEATRAEQRRLAAQLENSLMPPAEARRRLYLRHSAQLQALCVELVSPPIQSWKRGVPRERLPELVLARNAHWDSLLRDIPAKGGDARRAA